MSSLEEAELCYPHLRNSSCRRILRPHSLSVFISIILSFISGLTVTLNLLVIITISHFKKLHSPTNFFLLSLAFSDFLVGFLFPFQILLMDGCWYLSAGWCVFFSVLSAITNTASIGTVVLISIDRHIAVCNPLHYRTKVTAVRANMGVVLCWLFSALWIPAHQDDIKHPGGFNLCIGECRVYLNPVVQISGVFLYFILPVVIIVTLYVRVFVVAVSQARAINSHVTVVTLKGSQKVNRSELKAARVLGLVVVVFLSCLTPFYIVALSAGFTATNLSFFFWVGSLYYCNSLMNPMIYAFLYPWFRKGMTYIFSLQILKSGSSDANIL